MSLLSFLKLSYYFDSFLGYTFPGFWVILGILLGVFILSLIGSAKLSRNKRLSGQKKALWGGWVNLGYLLSLGGMIWLFFRYQGLYYLNWRFWPVLLLIGVGGWAGYLIYFQRIILPKKLADQQAKVTQAAYFRRRRRK